LVHRRILARQAGTMSRLLAPAPPTFVTTRNALHAVAEWVLASARFSVEGRIGLCATPDGFGTPRLPDGRQLRVAGTDLVVESEGALALTRLESLGDAATAAGVEQRTHPDVYEATTAWTDEPLDIDRDGARCLADWFAFTASVLEEFRVDANEPSEIQLWPEHFDLAMDVAGRGSRVNVGGSPGDDDHPLPYLYVGPWSFGGDDPFWNEPFGASLGYDQLVAASDPRQTALSFLRSGVERV
jgi:hypothetical protein